MICRALVAGVLFLSLLGTAAAGSRKLYPVDEAAQDPSFLAFRKRLLQAARQRNVQFLLKNTDPDIFFSFGLRVEEQGVRGFRKSWALDRPNSRLWPELIEVLSMGGSFVNGSSRRQFCAPYVFSRFPDDVDPYSHGAITAAKVEVRARPSRSAPVIAVLSYDIVRLVRGIPPYKPGGRMAPYVWMEIVTPDGRTGYVPIGAVRWPFD
jgi:hypothetical protein